MSALLLVSLLAFSQCTRLSRSEISALAGDWWPFGCAVRVVGDLDGDGAAEFSVGQPRSNRPRASRGRVLLFSGANHEVLHHWLGEREQEHFGFSLAAGDLDGDGVPDLVVGAPGTKGGSGRVYAYSGSTFELLASYASGRPGDDFGWAVAVGDVVGDPALEVIVGAPSRDSCTGAVQVFDAGGTAVAELAGVQPGERFGWSLATGADFDHDGRDEVVVGAPWAPRGGRASVFSVPTASELSRLFGGEEGDQFGYSVAVVRHLFAPQLAVGAPGRDAEHVDEGAVTLFWGPGPDVEVQWSGCSTTPARRTEDLAFGPIHVDPSRHPDPERRLHGHGPAPSMHLGCRDGMRFGHSVVALPVPGSQAHDPQRSPELAVAAPFGFSTWGCPSGWLSVFETSDELGERQSGSLPLWGYGWSLDTFPAGEDAAVLLVGAPGDGIFTSAMADIRPSAHPDPRLVREIPHVEVTALEEPKGTVVGKLRINGESAHTLGGCVTWQLGEVASMEWTANGDYRMEEVPAGEGLLTYHPWGLSSWHADPPDEFVPGRTARVQVVAGEQTRHDFHLEFDTAELSGRVVDSLGRGVPGQTVFAMGYGLPVGRSVTREDGTFALTVPRYETSYAVEAHRAGASASRAASGTGETEIEVVLPTTGRLRCRFLDASGAARRDIELTFSTDGRSFSHVTGGAPDEAGWWEFDLPAGIVILRVHDQGVRHPRFEHQVHVPIDDCVELELGFD